MIDKTRLEMAWAMHLSQNEHLLMDGNTFECYPEYCLDDIILEYDKLLWADNPHSAFNPAHDPECGECKEQRRWR